MNREKKIALLIVKVIIAIHFFLLFLFCIPDGLLHEKTREIASAYANPLFQGRWNLFAPDPPKRHKEIIFRYNNDQWERVVGEIEKRHNAIRIGSSTKMYHVVQNASHYLWEDYYKYPNEDIKKSIGYKGMEHLLGKYIENKIKTPPFGRCEMALLIEYTDKQDGGEVVIDTLHFPPFEFVLPYH